MIKAILLISDAVNTYGNTNREKISRINDSIGIDTVRSIINSQSGDSLLQKIFSYLWLIIPSILFPLFLWFFNGRPIIFIRGTGKIEQVKGAFGKSSGDSQLVFTLINKGKRAARIIRLQVEGYNDPGPTVPIKIEENGRVAGGLCFQTNEQRFQNPLASDTPLDMKITLDLLGATAHFVVITVKYKDDELKLYWKKKSYYYIVRDGQLQELVNTEKSRLDMMIKREKKLA